MIDNDNIDNNINSLLGSYNFDIKITRDARFMDQKVTPDVLTIVADCIIQFVGSESKEFTARNIWENGYTNENVKDIFNKPDVSNKKARSEYDKFFAQPLRMLAYAGVLNLRKVRNRNFFTVNNYGVLSYISIKERNALNFIIKYLTKVLVDSDIFKLFNNFFLNNNEQNFHNLKSKYEQFIIDNTSINQTTEVRRIFTKILNPLCYNEKVNGTKSGYFSKDVTGYDELMYNRTNWRDVNKKRGETRIEYDSRVQKSENAKNAFIKFTVEKAKRLIKERHKYISEVDDAEAVGKATQAHHIFPKSTYPKIESYLENLILLTGTQHNSKAHPNNNTHLVDKDYQLSCILSKFDSIEKSINTNDGFYSKEDFIFVLNEGVSPNDKFNENGSFKEIKEKVVFEYQQTG
ncbi:hypothetical protein [Bathymodiolus septemdierum thioautotrophic gill symbiont]|uniref:Restriction endonuclease n=1 Tax=endosymbiont of Bathymodiolus septemdierum str. Myojin knoll TaxID=1303921 RepID=A0A0P0UT77_9GAMM|nr:hypothetical protein [Bathymodiolus septemdierum thioautotrophic gill symbiont]BAS68387.1 conserved hypothetical protein [endosymbiont of Bathymodiolus septemdierum str. Myojin knoll]